MPDVVSMPLQPMAVHFRGGIVIPYDILNAFIFEISQKLLGTISPGTERYSEELEKFVQFRAVHGPTLV